jgi:hypothetical protein
MPASSPQQGPDSVMKLGAELVRRGCNDREAAPRSPPYERLKPLVRELEGWVLAERAGLMRKLRCTSSAETMFVKYRQRRVDRRAAQALAAVELTWWTAGGGSATIR